MTDTLAVTCDATSLLHGGTEAADQTAPQTLPLVLLQANSRKC